MIFGLLIGSDLYVDEVIVDQQSTSDGLCDEFDESQCDLKACSMGRRTDGQGCVVSCDCADEAIIEGDIKLTSMIKS